MRHLFLDANTYLAFYSLPKRDIAELDKLSGLLAAKQLTLYLPTQVQDEVRRNRAKVIADLLKPLREARLQVSVPSFATDLAESDELKKNASNTHKALSTLLEELMRLSMARDLPADQLIDALFSKAMVLSEMVAVQAASHRRALGNPPGKASSLGDAVNWEHLLACVPEGEPLHLVSADSDFASPLDSTQLHEFLSDEWSRTKNSDVCFYQDIRSFLDNCFPQIRLASDVHKYLLIESLINSPNFAETHQITARLLKYSTFNLAEASLLLAAGLENSQVRWLAQDEDVAEVLRRAIGPHRAALPSQLLEKWDYVMTGQGHAYGPVPTEADLAGGAP
jgi:hypothetical protein